MKIFLTAGAALLCLSLTANAVAADDTTTATDELPSMEMLEFLATFEDDDTGWVDPMELVETDDASTDATTKEESHDE